MKLLKIRTETAVIGSNLPCVVCGEKTSELAIIPIGLPPVAGVHKKCVELLHRKKASGEATESPVVPTSRAAEGPESRVSTPGEQENIEDVPKDQRLLSFWCPTHKLNERRDVRCKEAFSAPYYICPLCNETLPEAEGPTHWMRCTSEEGQRAVLVRRAIAEKLLPEGLPLAEAWTRLQYAAPKGWFRSPSSAKPYGTIKTEAPGERIDLLQLGLAERGINVLLTELAAWPVEHRSQARTWLDEGGERPAFFPSGCMACNNGIPNEGETAYKHTGEGPGCRAQYVGGPITGVVINGKSVGRFCSACGVEITAKQYPKADGRLYCSVRCLENNAAWLGEPEKPLSPEAMRKLITQGEVPATYLEAGRVCAREGCGKTVEERNSTRVGDELYCSAKCALPKGLAAVAAKTPAAERTIPLPLEKPNLDW